jgi:hypothetical protein
MIHIEGWETVKNVIGHPRVRRRDYLDAFELGLNLIGRSGHYVSPYTALAVVMSYEISLLVLISHPCSRSEVAPPNKN